MIKKLDKYPLRAIKWAFEKWTDQSNDFPGASDLINLIDPPTQALPWSRSEYKKIKDEWIRTGFKYKSDIAYVEGFELAQRNGERIYP